MSGIAAIVGRIGNDLKDETDGSPTRERHHLFVPEQATEDQVMLNGFGTVANALGEFTLLPPNCPPPTFRFRYSCQALPYPNRLHDTLASQQQERKSSSIGS